MKALYLFYLHLCLTRLRGRLVLLKLSNRGWRLRLAWQSWRVRRHQRQRARLWLARGGCFYRRK